MHSKKATQPHHNPYRLFIAFCCIYFLALPRLAIGQTQEQKTQAMTEILVEQKIEAERKQIDKAKQEILGKNNKSPALPGWIEIFAAIAGAAALFFVKSHFSTKRAHAERINEENILEAKRSAALSEGRKIPSIKQLGEQTRKMTLNQIAEITLLSIESTRLQMVVNGMTCKDFDGATYKANYKRRNPGSSI